MSSPGRIYFTLVGLFLAAQWITGCSTSAQLAHQPEVRRIEQLRFSQPELYEIERRQHREELARNEQTTY